MNFSLYFWKLKFWGEKSLCLFVYILCVYTNEILFLTNWEICSVFCLFSFVWFLSRNGFLFLVAVDCLIFSMKKLKSVYCILSIKTCFDCIHMFINDLYLSVRLETLNIFSIMDLLTLSVPCKLLSFKNLLSFISLIKTSHNL